MRICKRALRSANKLLVIRKGKKKAKRMRLQNVWDHLKVENALGAYNDYIECKSEGGDKYESK
jgi:hypothetical protein